jgi:uncharacterized protein
VVGVATVVHVIVRYREARRTGLEPRAALASTMEQLAGPVAFACLTDAAGFAALMVSSVGPVQDFGLMMGLGSFLVLPSVVLLTPSLALFADSAPSREDASGRGRLGEWLERVLTWAQRYAVVLGIIGVLLTVAALFGSARLQVETAFTRNFRSDTRIVEQYQFVENNFGGAGVWELLIPVPESLTRDATENGEANLAELPPPTPVLTGVLGLEQELIDSAPLLTKAISIADSFQAALGRFDQMGFMGRAALSAAWGKMRSDMPEFIGTLYNVDPETGRAWIHVLLRAPEQLGAEEKTALIREVESIARKRFEGAEATGYYVLLANLIESLLADQWLTFGVSAGIVAAMMAVAFRSVPLAVVTMIPNTVPVFVLFGAMGWLGLPVNMGAAMIAAVSVGLSVDGSIHYIMLYQRLRRGGADVDAALARAQNSVGRAATYATLALMVGFGTLMASDFVPTIFFGVLVSLSMIGGLIGNLLVLPILIRVVDRRGYA